MAAEFRRVCLPRKRNSAEQNVLPLHTRKASMYRVQEFANRTARAAQGPARLVPEQEAGPTRMALRQPGQDS